MGLGHKDFQQLLRGMIHRASMDSAMFFLAMTVHQKLANACDVEALGAPTTTTTAARRQWCMEQLTVP